MTTNNKSYDEFEISDSWKNKFNILEKAGKFKGINYENYKSLSRKEGQKIGFNILAFLFQGFYYLVKKMYYKGAFILGAAYIYSWLISYTSIPQTISWLIPSVIVGAMANYDYFKFVTKNEIMWGKFPKIFSTIYGAIGFPVISILFWLIISGAFSTSSTSNFFNDFESSYQSSYQSAFVKNWKKSFVSSCAKKGSIERCTCVANKAATRLTVKELQNLAYTIKYIKKNIISKCR